MSNLLQELEQNPDKVREDIWCYDAPETVFDGVLESLSQLHTQLKVHRAFQTTAKLLRRHPSNKRLPNQQANRVRHFIKFVFEKTTRGEERQARLRRLDCNALKFCGLSYKVKDILELPIAEFDLLVANVTHFIHRQNLSHYLYREDVNKAVHSNLDPEDENLFKEFLKSHVEFRPTKRKRDEASQDQQSEPLSKSRSIQSQAQGPETECLTGDVYKLTIEDAQAISMSEQIGQEIWLTIPYTITSSPFITIPVSTKLSEQFATQRPQMM